MWKKEKRTEERTREKQKKREKKGRVRKEDSKLFKHLKKTFFFFCFPLLSSVSFSLFLFSSIPSSSFLLPSLSQTLLFSFVPHILFGGSLSLLSSLSLLFVVVCIFSHFLFHLLFLNFLSISERFSLLLFLIPVLWCFFHLFLLIEESLVFLPF